MIQRYRAGHRRDRAVVRHLCGIAPSDRTFVEGLPVTTLERTMVDCASRLPVRDAFVMMESGFRLGADRAVVGSIVAARPGARGVRQARLLLGLADGRTESAGEALTLWVLRGAGLPEPELQVELRTSLGVFRTDFAWPTARVVLEFDGHLKYSGRFGHATDVLQAERRRQQAIEDAGWRVIRLTWDEIDDPNRWLAALRRALAVRTG
ncbi:endonuclease domain-containing protein [Actinotalea sp. M2MS4P-6]|nr:endonuclease domain-containing protein [Actinotalea sp. M2MS4P-6]